MPKYNYRVQIAYLHAILHTWYMPLDPSSSIALLTARWLDSGGSSKALGMQRQKRIGFG